MEIDKENIVQAVVIMDTFNNNFDPINKTKPMGLYPAAGVALVDYILESLAYGGVGEVILFCCQDGSKIKEHIKRGIETKSPWSLTMEAHVMMSETCQSMGDVMREIDAAAIVKGYFVLAGSHAGYEVLNSYSHVATAYWKMYYRQASYSVDQRPGESHGKPPEVGNARPVVVEILGGGICSADSVNIFPNNEYRQTCKKDKGAAMTLVYKKVSWEHPLISFDKPIFLAADANTKKILIHKKYKPRSNERNLSLPLEIVLNHSEVNLHHNLADANIALCSPTVPPLFSDNFDFQTRDDFIHGILINEEILASSLYYTLLKEGQYAAAVTNWNTYKIICRDILHYWVHPLSIETGSFYQNNYIFLGNHNFRKKSSKLSRSCALVEDVLIGDNTQINDHTTVSKSMIGSNCVIGNNVTIKGSHIMNYVVIKDNCKIIDSFIDDNCVIEADSVLEAGAIIASNVQVKSGSQLKGNIIDKADEKENEKTLSKSTSESGTEWENESSGSGADDFIGFNKSWSDSDSYCSSDSSAESSLPDSPVPEDTNIFLQEVIDSLARGYEEKLKCDYLILEINSSRYAYNIQLHEVNFFVVRALLSMPVLAETKNVLVTVKDILKYFRPVISNYIKTKSSIMDCLKAVEDSCIKCEWLNGKSGQVVHLLYEADFVDEDSLIEWFKDLKEDESPIANQASLVKFFEWLQEASEESEGSE